MTQQSTKKEYNTFIGGIITEAGPLTYPENASLDEENMVLNPDGSRQRRLGMDIEENGALRTVTNVLLTQDVAVFPWENVANDPARQFAVVQAGTGLLVFNMSSPTTSISQNLVAVINIAPYTTGQVLGTASGMGYFFVAGGVTGPFYLSYNPVNGAVTLTPFRIDIRDTFGVDDGEVVNGTPVGLSHAHQYNLRNQGWPVDKINAFRTAVGVYPANNQQWFLGKNSTDDFDASLLQKQDFGTTPAPKGRFIIDAFSRSTDRITATPGLNLPADIETGYPTAVAFAFERVWYAGMKSKFNGASEFNPNYSGFVFYSRTLRGVKDIGQCYTDADPTSEHDSELVDTDGGWINIPESGKIYKLVQKGGSILVFAEHGVWEIGGGEYGFTATQHYVSKISNYGVMGSQNIVDAESVIFYWNKGGIYIIAPDQATGHLSSQNISEKKIQTLYNQIDVDAKKLAVGAYDPVRRKVMWLYGEQTPTEPYTGTIYKQEFNRELVYDVVLDAWYKNSITRATAPTLPAYVGGYIETPNILNIEPDIREREKTVTKYLLIQWRSASSVGVSFAHYKNGKFRDWEYLNGVGYPFNSFLITGYEVMGDSARTKQSPYIVMHFKRTETKVVDGLMPAEFMANNPSGALVQARWDWSNHADSGKWGAEFQAYRLTRPYIIPSTAGAAINYGYEVISTKSRLRGSGKALSLYIHSDGDKDMYLYGWALRWSGKAYV